LSGVVSLSLHDALPISRLGLGQYVFDEWVHERSAMGLDADVEEGLQGSAQLLRVDSELVTADDPCLPEPIDPVQACGRCDAHRRSEEHTSELQSRENLV